MASTVDLSHSLLGLYRNGEAELVAVGIGSTTAHRRLCDRHASDDAPCTAQRRDASGRRRSSFPHLSTT